MAVTETPPETVQAASASTSADRPQITGLAAVLGSGDHKVIGRLYIVTALVFGLMVSLIGEAFAVEALDTAKLSVFGADVALAAWSLFRLGSVFLVAFPLVIGVAMAIVPMQVGARTVAFPRAAAASYWTFVLGGLLLLVSYGIDGGPGGTSDKGIDLWIVAMGLVVASVLLAAVCLATTVLALRTPGMTLDRTPMFAWSVLVASVMWLVTLPVAIALLVVMYVDHRTAGSLLLGKPAVLFSNLTWLLRNPQIYVVAIPVLGFATDVLATAGGRRLPGRGVARSSIAAFGVLSFGAFLAYPTSTALTSTVVVVMGVVALAPVLGVASTVAGAFRRGSFQVSGGVLLALAALVMLLVAVLAGAIGSIPGVLDTPADRTLSDNIFFVGVSGATVISALIAAFGGLHWWGVKIGRQAAKESLGMMAALVLLVGGLIATLPDLLSGLFGSGTEVVGDYTGGVEALNVGAVIGMALLVIGMLIAAVSVLPLARRTDEAQPADPWGGQTLEWATASPPPLENFDGELAVVTSAEPLIDLHEEK